MESDLDFNVIEPNAQTQFLLYGLHGKGNQYIDHYGEIKLHYKFLAVGWLTSLFLGLAFLLVHQETTFFSLGKMILISTVTLFAWIGVKFLRYLDINIYHKQMSEIFISLCQLEDSSAYLSHSNSNMGKLLHRRWFDPVIMDSCFYAAIGIIILILGSSTLYIKLSQEIPDFDAIIICFSIIIIFLIWEVISLFRSLAFGGSRVTTNE